MNTEPHNSTTPSVVTGPKRFPITEREQDIYRQGYKAGRRDASREAHPAGLHKPVHGGYPV